MAEENLQQVTPFMHVSDVDETVRFFVEKLGFRALVHARDYAYVHRESVGFRIFMLNPPTTVGSGRWAYYIDVKDVAAVEAELRPKLADVPGQYLHGPVDQSYGQRELMVGMPDGLVLVYGESMVAMPVEGFV